MAGNITNYQSTQFISSNGLRTGNPIGSYIVASDGWYSDGVWSYYVTSNYVSDYNTDPCYTPPPPPPPPPGCDPYGTFISSYCSGYDKYITYADGYCGSFVYIEYNSVDCGYTGGPIE